MSSSLFDTSATTAVRDWAARQSVGIGTILPWAIDNVYFTAIHTRPPPSMLPCRVRGLEDSLDSCIVRVHSNLVTVQVRSEMGHRPHYSECLEFGYPIITFSLVD